MTKSSISITKIGRARTQSGGVMVESALILTTVLMMILFIMDTGRMLLSQQFFAERARMGARYAAVNNWTSTMTANFVCYNSTTAPSGQAPVAGMLGLLPSQVTVAQLGTQGTPDYRIQVTIQGVPMFSWVPGMAGMYVAPPAVASMPVQSLGATN